MSASWAFWLTLAWFALTYAGLAVGKLPRLLIDRTGIALVGAALILATGVLTFPQAVEAIDFKTIALLLGMMIVVAYLRLAGFFDRLANLALACVRRPHGLRQMRAFAFLRSRDDFQQLLAELEKRPQRP